MYINNNSNIGMATLLQQQNKNIVKTSATANTSATAASAAPTVLPDSNGNAILMNNRVIVGGGISTTGILVNNNIIVGNNSAGVVGGVGATGVVVGSGGGILHYSQPVQQQPQQQTSSSSSSMQSVTNSLGTASIITYNQYQLFHQQQQRNPNPQIVTTTSGGTVVNNTNRTSTTGRLLMSQDMVSIPKAVTASGATTVSGVGTDGLVMIPNSASATAPGTTATQGAFLVAATPVTAATSLTTTLNCSNSQQQQQQFTQQREQSQIAKIQYSNNNHTIAAYIPNRILSQQPSNLSTVAITSTKSVAAATANLISTNSNISNSSMNTTTTNASNSIRYFAQIGQQQQQQQQNIILKRTVVSNNNISGHNNVIVLNRSNANNIGLPVNAIATTSAATFFAQRHQQVRYTNAITTSTLSPSFTEATVPNDNNVGNNIANTNNATTANTSKTAYNDAIDCSNQGNNSDVIGAVDASKSINNATATDDAEPEVDIVINNVVCSFSVRCHLSLRDIALKGSNVEYRRENGMVTMKLRRPYTTASIWSSGRITCTGATSETQAKIAARRYARCLSNLGFPVHFQNFRIVNVLGTCSMPWAIKIVNFSERFRENASYEPELHPGVTYKMRDPKATLKIFSTGSITVTAASVADVQSAIEHIYPLVFDFRKKRSPEELQQLRAKQRQISHADPNELEDILNNSNDPKSTNRNTASEASAVASEETNQQNSALGNNDNSIKRNTALPTLEPASTNARRKATETWASKQQNKRPCYTGGVFAAATTGSNLAIRNRLGGVGGGGGGSGGVGGGGGGGGSNVLVNKSVARMFGQKHAVKQQRQIFQLEDEDEDIDDPDAFDFDPEELIEVDENAL